jgi:acetolactate synthase-1/2/3 large subunit
MNCAQVLLEGIKAMGARHIYGVIGTSTVAFVNALYDYQKDIRYISCRHEQVAASMADTEGRLTGIPGVVLTHSGPGTFNALISIGNAYKDCSPMICLSGSVKRKLKGSDGMLEADHLRIFAPLCKGLFRLEHARSTEAVFSRAYSLAVSGARGPVLIEVPEDVWEEEVKVESLSFRLVPEPTPPIRLEDVHKALERLKAARRPLLLAGGGVAYARCANFMVSLAEALQAPVITTGNGRGTIPETHSLCLGRVGFGGGNPVADTALSQADVTLGLGCTISDMTTYEYTLPVSGEVILVNIDLKALLSSHFKASFLIQADIKDFLEATVQELNDYHPPVRKEWWNVLEPVREQWNTTLRMTASSDKVPLSPARVISELSRIVPKDHIITVGAGLHLLYPMAFLPCLRPLSFLSAVNFGSMGFGFPASLAARLVYPEREVVAILGDGDFIMTVQDLETAVREGIKVRILIINDGMYRVLNFRQRVQYQGRILGTCHSNPDFAALARSFGAKGWRLERPEDIRPVLEEALRTDGPAVLDVIVDPNDMPPFNYEAAMRMSQTP